MKTAIIVFIDKSTHLETETVSTATSYAVTYMCTSKV